MYSVLPYTITFGIAELPYLIIYSLLHVGLLWSMVDFFPHNNAFLMYLFVHQRRNRVGSFDLRRTSLRLIPADDPRS